MLSQTRLPEFKLEQKFATNVKRTRRFDRESKTPRSFSFDESPSIDQDRAEAKGKEKTQQNLRDEVPFVDSSRNVKEILVTQSGESISCQDDDDDDEFDVSDQMLNDSIFLQRPFRKGNSINYNVFSICDDQSYRANANLEP